MLIKLRSEVCVERLIKLTEPGNVQYTDVVRRALEGKALVDPFHDMRKQTSVQRLGQGIPCIAGLVRFQWDTGKQENNVHVVSTNKGLPLT